jgi:hypothetical protein
MVVVVVGFSVGVRLRLYKCSLLRYKGMCSGAIFRWKKRSRSRYGSKVRDRSLGKESRFRELKRALLRSKGYMKSYAWIMSPSGSLNSSRGINGLIGVMAIVTLYSLIRKGARSCLYLLRVPRSTSFNK